MVKNLKQTKLRDKIYEIAYNLHTDIVVADYKEDCDKVIKEAVDKLEALIASEVNKEKGVLQVKSKQMEFVVGKMLVLYGVPYVNWLSDNTEKLYKMFEKDLDNQAG